MRLFVAIDLNDQAREAIAAEQKRLEQALRESDRSAPRWVRPTHMHLTLAFLGEVDEARGFAVVDAIRAPMDAAPFSVVFAGLGVFPPHGAPRVLWLGVTAGHGEMIAVQRRIVARLEPAGLPPDQRAYHPHLTLGRWRDAKPSDRRLLIAADRGAEIARVAVAAVTLYQSRLSPSGSSYTRLAEAELRT